MQKVIHFEGSIVEPSCTTHVDARSVLELKRCPLTSRGTSIAVQNVRPVDSKNQTDQSSATAVLVNDSGIDGDYYNQEYVLANHTGNLIQSGTYVITLTTP